MHQLIKFKCENKSQPKSDKCIFHDKHFLDIEENRKIVVQDFQKKIDEYFSSKNDMPLCCIGYHLYDLNIQGIEFANSVYFNEASISGSTIIDGKFMSNVSFTNAVFSGKGDVTFTNAVFSGKGDVTFTNAEFSGKGNVDFGHSKFSNEGEVSFFYVKFLSEGYVDFASAEFSGKGDVTFTNAEFSGKRDVRFSHAQFLKEGDVSFSHAKFSKDGIVDFSHAQFSNEGSVTFDGSKFSNKSGIYFPSVKFSNDDDVIFKDTEFSGKGIVDFTGAEFSGKSDVLFTIVQFAKEGNVFFTNVQFTNEGYVLFPDAQFSNNGNVFFAGTQFLNKGNVSFSSVQFANKGNVFFSYTGFSNEGYVYFSDAKFFGVTHFTSCKFGCSVLFERVNFMTPNDVRFETEDLSNVSFMSSDITKILFHENARFGILESKEEEFKILDERKFEECFQQNNSKTIENLKKIGVSLGNIVASYRNLRENYEYRLRYDEAGKFFIREMELKRLYRTAPSPSKFNLILIKLAKKLKRDKTPIPIQKVEYHKNRWPRRHFSLTGLYYHLSRYGESISRPVILGIIIVGLSTLFWLIQNNPTSEPFIPYLSSSKLGIAKSSTDNFINFTQISNNTHTLKALERSLADFLPLLSMPSDTKIGVIDFIVKIVGGALTFVLLGVALRRKFERKYTR